MISCAGVNAGHVAVKILALGDAPATIIEQWRAPGETGGKARIAVGFDCRLPRVKVSTSSTGLTNKLPADCGDYPATAEGNAPIMIDRLRYISSV